MTFPAFIAFRYLRPRRGRGLISVVSALAVLGFATGVGALIIALAVTNGFQDVLQQELVGATAQVDLLRKDPTGIAPYGALLNRMRALPHVTAVVPVVYDKVFLVHGGQSDGAVLKGVLPRDELRVSNVLARLRSGSWQPLQTDPAARELVLGSGLADQLGVAPGDSVKMIIPNAWLGPFGMQSRELNFQVSGVFQSGAADFDGLWAYTGLAAAQQLRPSAGDWASALEFKLDDIFQADAVAAAAQAAAGADYSTTTWISQNRPIFQALHLEKLGTVIVIGLVVLVAALNVLIMLTMLVMEKRKEIAVLIGMGARREQIRRIFVFQGLGIAGLGTLCGLVLAYPLAWGANRFHWIHVSSEVYSVDFIPFHAHARDGLLVAGLALAVGYLATLYPSRRAVAVLPAETLRYE